MKSAEQIKHDFLQKFDSLLAEYGAEFSCDDEYVGYPECGQDIHARVTINTKYDNNGNIIGEFVDIDLGKYRIPPRRGEEL